MPEMFRASALFVAATLMLGLAALPAAAQSDEAAAEADPVVAIVNGEEILTSDVLRSAESLPPQYQAQLAFIFPALIERLIDLKLLADAGRAEGYGEDERVRAIVAEAEQEAIRQVYISQLIDTGITDERLQAAFQTFLAENPPQSEVHARHILVDDEATAREVIAELDGGADFAELAKERSTGPTGPRGGDLGFFTKDQMVAPFAEAAFALEPGTYTKDPVETQFGWHVILVEERREQAPPTFEEVEEQLREQVGQALIEELVTELRANATIEMVGAEEPADEPPAAEQPAPEAPAAEQPAAQ